MIRIPPRCRAEIDLTALECNYKEIRKQIGNAKLIAVVKSNAYGHGARLVSQRLAALGTDLFAVAELREALELRSFGITQPILILGATAPQYVDVLAQHDLLQTVYSEEYGLSLGKAAQRAGVSIGCHLKIDAGMGRLGFRAERSSADAIARVFSNPALRREGVYMHFPSADLDGDPDGSITRRQFDAFTALTDELARRGLTFAMHHAGNSAAILSKEYAHLDAVRAGIILYGCPPAQSLAQAMQYHPVMRFCADITLVKEVQAGDTVSYGMTFRAPKPMRIATVAVGYADGYFRSLSSKGIVTVNGKRCPVLGRVCMDQLMIDVTDADCKAGDTAVLFGEGGISCEEYAALADTVNYEVICSIGHRVARMYLQTGEPIETESYLNCTL
ncbi:MAG: alanine racemase [Clostridia bacterium]|nr:alanine racemase [Clostridia bacterium]